MANNGKIWVSELNARPEVRRGFPRATVRFYDTTLRDGEQTVGVVLSPQQKLEIARELDQLVLAIDHGAGHASIIAAFAGEANLASHVRAAPVAQLEEFRDRAAFGRCRTVRGALSNANWRAWSARWLGHRFFASMCR